MRDVDQRAGNNHPIITPEYAVDLVGVTIQKLGLKPEVRRHFRIHAPISSQPLGSGYAGLGVRQMRCYALTIRKEGRCGEPALLAVQMAWPCVWPLQGGGLAIMIPVIP